jgi:hypothetical protein
MPKPSGTNAGHTDYTVNELQLDNETKNPTQSIAGWFFKKFIHLYVHLKTRNGKDLLGFCRISRYGNKQAGKQDDMNGVLYKFSNTKMFNLN